MPKTITSDAERVALLKSSIENAIAELRTLAVDPVEILCGQQLSIEVWPVSDGNRINVYRDGWGGTEVNYTSEGVIIDVYAGGDDGPMVHTATVFKEDLEIAEDEVATATLPAATTGEAVEHG